MSFAVRFENVTKRYVRGGPRYRSIRHDLVEGLRRVGSRLSGHRPEPRGILALDGVSFEVNEGESYAIVGPNGAGKTTALKLVSRISYPTGGRVRVRGRVAALIEVGSGVHPELTGRENVWLYGQILGMTKPDVRRRFDEIVEFAELGHALDTPVKLYSAGMQLRLGFAIASHLRPDVFLVDEALAVGDAGFQARCVEHMTKLVAEGHTLLFVSHNLPAVESLCERGLFLNGGKVVYEDTARNVLARYLEWVEESRLEILGRRAREGFLRVESVTCHGSDGTERYRFAPGEGIEIRLRFSSDRPLEGPHVNVGITDGRPGVIVQCSMLADGRAPARVSESWECTCRIEHLPLRPRLYQVYCDVHGPRGHGVLLRWSAVSAFRVVGADEEADARGPHAIVSAALGGAVEVPYEWRILDHPE